MNKILTLFLLLILSAIYVPAADVAKSEKDRVSEFSQSWRGDYYGHRRGRRSYRRYYRSNYGRPRYYTRTRYVRYGRRVYRETFRYTYLPNGRVKRNLIRRVRVR